MTQTVVTSGSGMQKKFDDFQKGQRLQEEYNSLPVAARKLITRLTCTMSDSLSREEVYNVANKI